MQLNLGVGRGRVLRSSRATARRDVAGDTRRRPTNPHRGVPGHLLRRLCPRRRHSPAAGGAGARGGRAPRPAPRRGTSDPCGGPIIAPRRPDHGGARARGARLVDLARPLTRRQRNRGARRGTSSRHVAPSRLERLRFSILSFLLFTCVLRPRPMPTARGYCGTSGRVAPRPRWARSKSESMRRVGGALRGPGAARQQGQGRAVRLLPRQRGPSRAEEAVSPPAPAVPSTSGTPGGIRTPAPPA